MRAHLQPDSVRFSDGALAPGPPDLPQLVRRGLRARLVSQSFVTGQKFVDLDFLPDTPARLTGAGRETEIPALPERFGNLIDQVATLPLRETVQELRDTLHALQQTLVRTQNTLDFAAKALQDVSADARQTQRVASTAMRQVQDSATATLASVARLSETSRETVLAAQPELQRTLAGAREAAQAAKLAMGRVAEMTAAAAPLRSDLDAAVRDLSQAARGLRDWSELLEEKPNAMIFGSGRQ